MLPFRSFLVFLQLKNITTTMRHLSFDDLRENYLFDYKDGDLLVIDDIRRLRLGDYLHTTLAFIMVAFCQKGQVQVTIDERMYRLVEG